MEQETKERIYRIASLVFLVVFLVMIILIYISIKNMDPSIACEVCMAKGHATCISNPEPSPVMPFKLNSTPFGENLSVPQ